MTQIPDAIMAFLARVDKDSLDRLKVRADAESGKATTDAAAAPINHDVSFIVRIPSGAHFLAANKTLSAIQETCSKMNRHKAEWEDLVGYRFESSTSTATLTFKTAKSMSVACCIPDINYALGLRRKLDHSDILSPKWISVDSDDPNAWHSVRPPNGDSAHKSDKESQHLQVLSSENGVSVIRLQVKFQHLLILLPFEDACSLLAFGISINGEKHKPEMANVQQFPRFCFRCHGPGHYATAVDEKSPGCPNPEKCGFCAESHGTATCKLKDSHVSIDNHPYWKCPNCGESHTAWSKECESPDVVKMRRSLLDAGWGNDESRGKKRVQELLQPRSAQGMVPSPPPSTPAGPPTGTSTSPFVFRGMRSSPPPFTPAGPLTGTAASPIDLSDTQSRQRLEWSSSPIMRRQAQPLPPPSTQPKEVTAPKPRWDRNMLKALYNSLPSEKQRRIDEIAKTYSTTSSAVSAPKPKRGRPSRKRSASGAAAAETTKKQRQSSPALTSALDRKLSDNQVSDLANECFALSQGPDTDAHSGPSADEGRVVVSEELKAQIGAPAPPSSLPLPQLAATAPAAAPRFDISGCDEDQLRYLLADTMMALNKISVAVSP